MEPVQRLRNNDLYSDSKISNSGSVFANRNFSIFSHCALPVRRDLKDITKCLTSPDSKSSVSNPNENIKSIFINGVFNQVDDSAKNAQILANSLGRDVVLVYNDTEKNKIKELFVGALSKFSPKWAAKYEPSVAELGGIFDQIIASKNKVDVHAHSQGAVLLQSAVDEWLDKKNITDDKKREQILNKHFQFTIYGAPESRSELPGVDYRKFSLDPIPLGAALFDGTIQLLKKIANDTKNYFKKRTYSEVDLSSSNKSSHTQVRGMAHEFEEYVKATPIFFLNNPSHRGPLKLSSALQRSIVKGEYADSVYKKIIDLSLSRGYLKNNSEQQDFLRALSEYQAQGKLENFHLSQNYIAELVQ
jgi:hypothetical protein